MMAAVSGSDLKNWHKEKNFMSHDITNEQITIMGATLVLTLYSNIRTINPAWFTLIADEATDVQNRELFNLVIRWFDDKCEASEEPVGSDTITRFLKDLIHYSLNITLCRGQAL